jgi:hypothetical protein
MVRPLFVPPNEVIELNALLLCMSQQMRSVSYASCRRVWLGWSCRRPKGFTRTVVSMCSKRRVQTLDLFNHFVSERKQGWREG